MAERSTIAEVKAWEEVQQSISVSILEDQARTTIAGQPSWETTAGLGPMLRDVSRMYEAKGSSAVEINVVRLKIFVLRNATSKTMYRYRLLCMVMTGALECQSSQHTLLTITRPVDVGVPEAWDPTFGEFMNNSYHYHPKNLDHNSGNPIGISVCQLSARDDRRVTASGSYLTASPPNLTIMTDTVIAKIVFEGKKAIGVEAEGKQCICIFVSLSYTTREAD